MILRTEASVKGGYRIRSYTPILSWKNMKSTHFQTRSSLGVSSPRDMTNHEGDANTQENRSKTYAFGGGTDMKLILLLHRSM